MNLNLKKLLPYVVVGIIFLTISIAFFEPQLRGYQLKQFDVTNYLGMSREIVDYRSLYHEEPLWTNSMFSGMPAYQISFKNTNLIDSIRNLFFIIFPAPLGYFILLMGGFLIMMLCFSANIYTASIASIAFSLSTFNILYMSSGHNTKVLALAFIPPIIGALVYTFRKNAILGPALLSFFISLQLSANHLQMTYYMLFFIGAVGIYETIRLILEKNTPRLFKIIPLIIIAGFIGILPALSNLMLTYEYGEESIRGKTELSIKPIDAPSDNGARNALSSDYIKEYSIGHAEIWSCFIPNIKGGASDLLGNSEHIEKANPMYRETIAEYPSYWGDQSYSGGAFYFGSTIFFLFILAIFFIKDKIKWSILAVSVLAMFLSWKYSVILDWFITHFPLFNKFRDTKMMLVIIQISLPLLGLLFVDYLVNHTIPLRKFLTVSGITILLLVGFYLMPNLFFDFLSNTENSQIQEQISKVGENSQAANQINEVISEIIIVREAIFKADVLRSILFILSIFSVLLVFINNKIKANQLYLIIGLIVLIDLWTVNKRYFNNEKKSGGYTFWQKSSSHEFPYSASAADQSIMDYEIKENPALFDSINQITLRFPQEKTANPDLAQERKRFAALNFSTNYRVFTLDNPFANSKISYFHKSIGGYHGAKLKRYQEIWEFYLNKEHRKLFNLLKNGTNQRDLELMLKDSLPVLNMLNTKYIITNTEGSAIKNPYTFGSAWFVDSISYVPDANAEMESIGKSKKHIATIQEKYKNYIGKIFPSDSSWNIQLKSYLPNKLVYESSNSENAFAVFSEIYYNKGWNAYIDGKRVEHCKTNYLLRGLAIPKGKHKIVFKFQPETYLKGKLWSQIASGLILVILIGSIGWSLKNKRINPAN